MVAAEALPTARRARVRNQDATALAKAGYLTVAILWILILLEPQTWLAEHGPEGVLGSAHDFIMTDSGLHACATMTSATSFFVSDASGLKLDKPTVRQPCRHPNPRVR